MKENLWQFLDKTQKQKNIDFDKFDFTKIKIFSSL